MRSLLAAPLVLLASSALALGFALEEEGPDLKAQLEALDSAGDHAGMVELLGRHRYQALQVIDSYLEGSLALMEQAVDPTSEQVTSMQARAIRGARAADEAFSSSIFGDYASAFVGWNAEQRAQFRGGQQAFGRARKALSQGDFEAALAEGIGCAELAEPLGDWWGSAMGWGVQGQALRGLERNAEALVPLSRARIINHELGLIGAEYGALRDIVPALVALERYPRARRAVDEALSLAEFLGDASGARTLLMERLKIERALGDEAAAEATAAELEKSAAR